MSRLLMISPAPVLRTETGLMLDAKFVEGMRLHQKFWPGEVDCILHEGAVHIPFGARENPTDLGFKLQVLKENEPVTEDMIRGYDLVICDADDTKVLAVPEMARRLGIKVFLAIEYILETRLQIAWLDRDRSFARRIYAMIWNIRQERRRKKAFKIADGVQANGYPAFEAYRPLNNNTMLYLDNRMSPQLFATDAEVADRAAQLRSGAPLRLIYSGRLEAMKGVQDLVPIAKILRDQGTRFTLEIFGTGSLRDLIDDGIRDANLGDVVTLHEPVDFEKELVPYNRQHADIYLCCHRQSDPSCSYLENMGCGLAVIGYGNRMWSALCKNAKAGWVTPLGDAKKLASAIAEIDHNREELVARCQNAINFAMEHDFHSQFQLRMEHLVDAIRD